jgi:hypothetical protein
MFVESLQNLPNTGQLMHTVEHNELTAIRPVKLANELVDEQYENMICEFSHIHVEHSSFLPQTLPFNYRRCFIGERLTHLHKSPRLNGRLTLLVTTYLEFQNYHKFRTILTNMSIQRTKR